MEVSCTVPFLPYGILILSRKPVLEAGAPRWSLFSVENQTTLSFSRTEYALPINSLILDFFWRLLLSLFRTFSNHRCDFRGRRHTLCAYRRILGRPRLSCLSDSAHCFLSKRRIAREALQRRLSLTSTNAQLRFAERVSLVSWPEFPPFAAVRRAHPEAPVRQQHRTERAVGCGV